MAVEVPVKDPTLDGGGNDFGDELSHWFCRCSPNKGLCGAKLDYDEGEEMGEDDPDPECVVCNDLVDKECPYCGE